MTWLIGRARRLMLALEHRAGTAQRAGRPPLVSGGGRVVGTASLTLWDVLAAAYARLGFDLVGDEAFKALVLARVIEPTSKADTVRVLAELGVPGPSLRTIFRSLARCVDGDYRDLLAKACMAHSTRTSGPTALILYDVTTLYFEAENEDELSAIMKFPRSEGFSIT